MNELKTLWGVASGRLSAARQHTGRCAPASLHNLRDSCATAAGCMGTRLLICFRAQTWPRPCLGFSWFFSRREKQSCSGISCSFSTVCCWAWALPWILFRVSGQRINEPHMSRRRMLGIAGVFAGFQALMPMTGWICVHTIVQYFRAFEKLHSLDALALLGFIGGKMLVEGGRCGEDDRAAPRLGLGALLVQGVATSIDALSVGFTIAEYDWLMALVCSLIIAAVTLCICLGSLVLGRRFGTPSCRPAQGPIIFIDGNIHQQLSKLRARTHSSVHQGLVLASGRRLVRGRRHGPGPPISMCRGTYRPHPSAPPCRSDERYILPPPNP